MFHEIAEFLAPFFAYVGERESLLLNAFHGHEAVLRKINYAGAASEFVPRLVRVLQSYGEIEPGTQALWQLLLTLRSQVGMDNQRQIDAFRAWANTSHKIILEPGDLAGSTIVNNNNRINISGNVQGGNINFGNQTVNGNLTITMSDMTQTIQKGSGVPDEKETLQKLVDQLRAELAKPIAPEQKEVAEKVARRTEELVNEVSEAKIDKEGVESKANLLKKAADNIQEALPTVFTIAMSIVAFGRRMVGL